MLQKGSWVAVIDNSGVSRLKIIGCFEGYQPRFVNANQIFLASVQRLRPRVLTKLKKGELSKALLLQTKKNYQRNSGLSFKAGISTAALLTTQERPVATRLKGFISKDLRKTRHLRMAFLGAGFF